LKTIFVGNLDVNATEDELRALFAAHGTVEAVSIVMDSDTGASRGLAFVEMTKAEEARAAISSLDGKPLKDRNLRVNEARPRLTDDPKRNSSRSSDHSHHQV
jgi:RNA recognition motif-containing protein